MAYSRDGDAMPEPKWILDKRWRRLLFPEFWSAIAPGPPAVPRTRDLTWSALGVEAPDAASLSL